MYRYPRYCFTNRSADILAIFCEHLDLIGVKWTRTAPDQIQVARHAAVARLDAFVGRKR